MPILRLVFVDDLFFVFTLVVVACCVTVSRDLTMATIKNYSKRIHRQTNVCYTIMFIKINGI